MSAEKLKLEPLTKQAFAPFGDVVESEGRDWYFINDKMVKRYHDLCEVDTGAEGGRTVVSICEAQPNTFPMPVRMVERHAWSSQAFIPVDDNPFVVVVAPPGETVRKRICAPSSPTVARASTTSAAPGTTCCWCPSVQCVSWWSIAPGRARTARSSGSTKRISSPWRSSLPATGCRAVLSRDPSRHLHRNNRRFHMGSMAAAVIARGRSFYHGRRADIFLEERRMGCLTTQQARDSCRDRLQGERDGEFRRCLEEIGKIGGFRLAALLGEGR